MSGLLIVTCGTTDLQFAVRSPDGTRFRIAAARRGQRALHERLLNGALAYEVDPEAENLPFMDNVSLGLKDGHPSILVSDRGTAPPSEVEIEEPLRVIPAKLSGVPDALTSTAKPDAVVVFNTHRDSDPDEPIAAGLILSRWLADAFGLEPPSKEGEIGLRKSGWVNFLAGDMTVEGLRGAPVNPVAVQRMDDALSEAREDWKVVTLAINGGIPAYRNQIRALARFRFQTANLGEYVQPQRAPGQVERLVEWELPSDSYRLRREVRNRLQSGDLIAAAALADQDPAFSRQEWSKFVKQAARYINGTLSPDETVPSYLTALVAPGSPRFLLPAVRAETAIRAKRIPEAALWTFAFFDAALLDVISRMPWVSAVDDERRTLDVRPQPPLPRALTDIRWGQACLQEMTAPSRRSDDIPADVSRYSYVTGGAKNAIWCRNLGKLGYTLDLFQKRFLKEINGLSPKDLRNSLTHSNLSVEKMKVLRQRFVDAGIWGAKRADAFFLSQPELITLSKGLGVPSPISLYNDLISGLCRDIDEHRLC